MPKVVSEDKKRVVLNCLVKPETLAWIRDFNGSQGEAVDAAVDALRGHRERGPLPDTVLPVYTKRATMAQMEPIFGRPEPRKVDEAVYGDGGSTDYISPVELAQKRKLDEMLKPLRGRSEPKRPKETWKRGPRQKGDKSR